LLKFSQASRRSRLGLLHNRSVYS